MVQFASYVRRVLHKTRLIFSRINGPIVAETMFLVMFPGVAKLGNICFGRKICVREAKVFLTPDKKKTFFVSEQQNLFPQHIFPRG